MMTIQKLLLTVSIAASAAFAQGTTTTTTTTTSGTRTFQFQPIGLGATETAQVNVYNSASNSSSGTAASCTGSISFLNASGTVIGSATTYTVTSGQASSVKLPFASSGGSGERTLIIAEVTQTFTSGTPCNLSVSLETYDTSSGATHVELGSAMGGGAGGALAPGH